MLRADVRMVEALCLVLGESENAPRAVVEVIERRVTLKALGRCVYVRRAHVPATAVSRSSPDGLPLPQHSFDRTDERGTDGSAGEAGDKCDDRDRAEVHAPLLRRAGCLVGLDRGGGRLRVRQMPCQWAR